MHIHSQIHSVTDTYIYTHMWQGEELFNSHGNEHEIAQKIAAYSGSDSESESDDTDGEPSPRTTSEQEPPKATLQEELVASNRSPGVTRKQEPREATLHAEDLVVLKRCLNHGAGPNNPLDKIFFYSRGDAKCTEMLHGECIAHKMDERSYRTIAPKAFERKEILVLCKVTCDVCLYACVSIYIYIYIYMFACVCVYIYIYKYI